MVRDLVKAKRWSRYAAQRGALFIVCTLLALIAMCRILGMA
jgi:hypothetical protein